MPDTYIVQFQAEGFETLEVSDVVDKAGTTITEDGVMKLGQLTETVNESSAPPVIKTTASNFTTSSARKLSTKFVSSVATFRF